MQLPLCLAALALAFATAQLSAVAPSTLLAQPDKEIVSDALTKESKSAEWKSAKGKWDRQADGLHAEEIPADMHGAVSRVGEKLPALIIAFDFRLDGAKTISLSINGVKDHMARVIFTPTSLRIQKDDSDHEGPDKAVVFLSTAVNFEPGTWHNVVLEMVGDTMVATIDGKISGFGCNELFKKEKVAPGFTCAGQSATFRNFVLWSAKAEPKATWKAASVQIAEAMKNAAPLTAPAGAKKAAAKKAAAQ